ncbi:MAG TPA: pyridoxal-phosphate dependent enzyme [Candidatus Dormibacteraeota bacterium]|nr:pyridoxal-phosphate dependent enzyme [Candidatus Dormibacteraeota bacterium]
MRDRLAARLARRPHAPVGIFPTPLQHMPRLSRQLGRPVYFKREDLAGLAVAGSKIRILQHTAGDALERGAEMFVAGGYVQSNHPTQVAAVGCALGVRTELMLDTTKGWEMQGNLLLSTLMRCKVHYVREGSYEAVRDACLRLVDRLNRRGRRARLLTLTPEIHALAALAYAEGLLELAGQLDAVGVRRADVFVGSGGPTYAGLLLGACADGGRIRVHGAPPHGLGAGAEERVVRVAGAAMQLLDLDVPVRPDDVSLLGRGSGVYGYTYPATVKTIWKVAQAEGVFLDPVYTGTGMAEMLRWAEAHRGETPVVFLHTGGVATLFAYTRELVGGRQASSNPARRISRLGVAGTRRRQAAQT